MECSATPPTACDEARTGRTTAVRRRLDPRVSLVVLVALNGIVFLPVPLWLEPVPVVVCFALAVWCRRAASGATWVLAWAVLAALSFALTSIESSVAASFAFMAVMVKRLLVVGMFAANMIATTCVGEMASALQRAHLPRGGIVALSVALRFAPTMAGEFVSVVEAMRVRGMALTPASVVRHPIRIMENLLVPVMSRLSIVADELSNAAVVRGIDSDRPRTSYYDLRIGAGDVVFGLAFIAVVVAFASLRSGSLT